MKLLKPQRLRPEHFDAIRRELEGLFYEILYKPVVTTIKAETGLNTRLNASTDALEQALREGKVQFWQDGKGQGKFFGKFNARVAKQIRDMGGRLDTRASQTIYNIAMTAIPGNILVAAALAEQKAKDLHAQIDRDLDNVQDGLNDKIDAMDLNSVEGMVVKIDADTVGVLKDAAVMPSLSDDAMINLSEDYNTNMKLYIKKWAEERIEALRGEVEANAKEGYRFDRLIGRIRDDYNVSQRKAEFLARQETGLFMAKFRRERLGDAGVRAYKWSARSSKLTRPDHWALNGKVYSYDSPPITDRASGRRNNPGEDYNCLCADIPILGRVAVEAVA